MQLSLFYERPTEPEALAVVHAAIDAGITLIDTADVYCAGPEEVGHNERLVGRALRQRGRAHDVFVATKGGLVRGRDGGWLLDADPQRLERACEASLRALGVECIDLYQLHSPDPAVPIADAIGAMERLRRAGKIRYIGVSNFSVRQLRLASEVAQIASVQNCLGPWELTDLRSGVLAACVDQNIAYIAYNPLGGRNGVGRISRDADLCRIAQRHEVSPHQVTLAWLLELAPNLIPIPGTTRIEHQVDNAAALALTLAPEEVEVLNAAFIG